MKKRFITIILSYLLLILSLSAQDATPSPTPEIPPAPEVKDIQEVNPDKLKGVPEIGPDYRANDKKLPDLGRVGVDMIDQKPIALREVLTLALENNKDIEVSRQSVKSAEYDLQAADGFYIPRISGQSYYEKATTPNLSVFGTNRKTTQDAIAGNISYQGFIKKYGSSYTFTLSQQKTTTDSQVSALTPQYNTNFSFNFTQPLRRGRKIDQNRRVIEIAKKNLSLTDIQFRQKSIDVIVNAQRAYWDLTFALRNLQVQRDGVRDAKEQLEHNKRLVNEGLLAPIDAIAAETQVANLELAVYDALEVVNRAENALKNLIAVDKDDPIWGVALIPTDKIDIETPATTLPEALDIALQNRPEIEVNETAKEINQIDQRFLREQKKSQIDFFVNYTSAGISGKENPNTINFAAANTGSILKVNEIIARVNGLTPSQVPIQRLEIAPTPPLSASLTGGYFSSITDIFAQRYPTFRAGITFSLPFRNKVADAQLGKSLVEADKINTQRSQLEQAILVDVRNALQSLRTAEARLRATAIARDNSQKQYESEQRKLDAGQSDVYRVLERQTALMNAKSAELRSQIELNKAIAELQRATGNSLKANNVEARLRK